MKGYQQQSLIFMSLYFTQNYGQYIFYSVYLGHLPPKAGHEPDKLGEYRRKLIDFLENSKHYLPERLLTRFPIDGEYI